MRIVLYILGGLVLLILVSMPFLNRGMREIKNLKIKNVDLAGVADGTYQGSYVQGRWKYTVDVTVLDHAITDIVVKPGSSSHIGSGFDQAAIDAVIQAQRLDIDTVSGASVTTKAFLKAVENALTNH